MTLSENHFVELLHAEMETFGLVFYMFISSSLTLRTRLTRLLEPPRIEKEVIAGI